jgi:uncharacterized protein (DUF1800 family)
MPGLTRRDALAEATRKGKAKGKSRAPTRPGTPQHLHTRAVTPSLVSLTWGGVHPHPRHLVYEVYRNGRHVATPHHHALFNDHGVKPLRVYRYRVRARVGRVTGRWSRTLTVRTPSVAPYKPPINMGPPSQTLTQAMVDRLFWRAGFGPSATDRQNWIGKPPSALVDWFLSAPYALRPTSTPPTNKGAAIDPLASDEELQMEWLDRMQRSLNPLPERMTFFWHRHFAVSRDAGVPAKLLLAYRDRLRRYSDFAANPDASFHDLAVEMTTQDAAMSLYLTGYLNQKNKPNENYAREFMELFCLGVTDAGGNPNYSQTDVRELARAFTGYALDQAAGTVSFKPGQFDTGVKTILGQTGSFDAPGAVNVVLAHPNHAPFLVRKLWSEFIQAPIPADALAPIVSAYVSSGFKLVPLLKGILNHPLIFDSLGESPLTKPPVVYAVGVLRALDAPLRDRTQTDSLYNMQQQPYHPPNVAGWEGGLSWMTTATSVARFDLVGRCQALLPAVADVPGETAQAAFDRAYATSGSPWISGDTRAALLAYAQQVPAQTAPQRRARQKGLTAFILGGPDGQVM